MYVSGQLFLDFYAYDLTKALDLTNLAVLGMCCLEREGLGGFVLIWRTIPFDLGELLCAVQTRP
jgi:hypothetical protein